MREIFVVFVLLCAVLAAGCEQVVEEKVEFGAQERPAEEKPAQTKKSEKEVIPEVQEVEVGVLETKFGKIVIEFHPELAPRTVARIKELIRSGFYNGITFHRVERGFCIQGGDPTGTGSGGTGVNIPGEFTNTPFVEGSVGMARGNDPNSNDCQFFITLGRAAGLDGKYTLFGKVIEGLDVAHEIEKVPVVARGRLHYAREPIEFIRFRLERRKLKK